MGAAARLPAGAACAPLPVCASLSNSSAAWSRLSPFFSAISRFSSPTLMYIPSNATVSDCVALLNLHATRDMAAAWPGQRSQGEAD